MDFSKTHPIYDKNYYRWVMAKDFYTGGRAVISPDHYIGEIFSYKIKENDDETKPYEYTRTVADYNTYLFQHQSEKSYEFEERNKRSYYIAYFRSEVDKYITSIFRIPIDRKTTDALWSKYHDDIDGHNTSIDEFTRTAATEAMIYGRSHILCDVEKSSEQIISLAQQQERGIRAYCAIVSPLSLINWDMNHNHQFRWIVIKETAPSQRMPGEDYVHPGYGYRVWDTENWYLFAEGKNGYVEIDSGRHGIGYVPLATIWATERFSMDCETPLSSNLDLDRHILNKLSDSDNSERMESFSQMILPDDGSLGKIEVGPNRVITVPFQSTVMPTYISPDPSIPAGVFDRIDAKVEMANRLSPTSRGKAEESKEARSAAAIRTEWTDRSNSMAQFASQIEQADHDIHFYISQWEGRIDYPQATYGRTFDLRSLTQKINDLILLKSTEILTPSELRKLAEPIISESMREHGYTSEEINRIMDDYGNA